MNCFGFLNLVVLFKSWKNFYWQTCLVFCGYCWVVDLDLFPKLMWRHRNEPTTLSANQPKTTSESSWVHCPRGALGLLISELLNLYICTSVLNEPVLCVRRPSGWWPLCVWPSLDRPDGSWSTLRTTERASEGSGRPRFKTRWFDLVLMFYNKIDTLPLATISILSFLFVKLIWVVSKVIGLGILSKG